METKEQKLARCLGMAVRAIEDMLENFNKKSVIRDAAKNFARERLFEIKDIMKSIDIDDIRGKE